MRNLTILFLLLITVSCSNKQTEQIKFDKQLSKKLLNQLNVAYKDSSKAKLEVFLYEWANKYVPKKNKDMGMMEKQIYSMFYNFYCPYNLKKLGRSEWGEINKNYKYLIIQNNIGVNWHNGSYEYKINDFRPTFNFNDSIKVLSLTLEYDSAITKFLNDEFFPSGSGSIMSPAIPKGDTYLKYKFLRDYLNIFMGHSGRYWQLVTPPIIERIEFKFPYFSANLDYRFVYTGNTARFVYSFGKWKMKILKNGWIE